jgi:hypothetical protein
VFLDIPGSGTTEASHDESRFAATESFLQFLRNSGSLLTDIPVFPSDRHYHIAVFCHPFAHRQQALVRLSENRWYDLNRTVLALNFDLCQLLTRNRKFLSPNEHQRISRAAGGHKWSSSSLQGLIESRVTPMDERSSFS